jgi:transposase
MAGFITGDDLDQPMLLPAMVQDYIAADASVRVIDAFVKSLDLHKLGFERARPNVTGRPGYEPGLLLRLYIYGYLNGPRSSRRLEKACRINLEVIWLARRLAPDFKTIADFRRDNHAGITGACKAFVRFCRDVGLFDGATATIDGTKVRAAASRKSVIGRKELEAETVELDRRIAAYLAEMDVADQAETDDVSDQRTQAALEQLKARRAALLETASRMAEEERELGVVGEAEAHPMGYRGQPKPPSYNVQAAVDPKSHMIVHHDVTTEATDNRLLFPMARATKEVLGAETLRVVADAGYANASHAAACEAHGITPAAPAPRPTNTRGAFFPPDVFIHDARSDTLTCPAGRRLVRNGSNLRDEAFRYRAEDCSGCPLKQDCTTAPRRFVYRLFHEAALRRMTARVADDPSLMCLRRSTAEHPFATFKTYIEGRFRLRGRLKVETETSLAILGYNLKRAMNILGHATLRERLLA